MGQATERNRRHRYPERLRHRRGCRCALCARQSGRRRDRHGGRRSGLRGSALFLPSIPRAICGVSGPTTLGLSPRPACSFPRLLSSTIINRCRSIRRRDFTIALASTSLPPAPPSGGSPRWRRRSVRETDGEFLVEVFPESRLGPDPKMFADLRSGALEFFMAGATLGEVAPTSALPLLPFAFRDSKAVFAALDGALGDQIRGELAQNGIHAFRHCLQNGFHHLTTSTRPIHTAADLAGLKIRSPGGAIARDFFEAFGAEAGYVPFSQMYDALKARRFRRAERPARRRTVAAALRGAEVSEPDCPLVVGFYAAGQRCCVASTAAGNPTSRRTQCREIRAAAARGHRTGQRRRRRRARQSGECRSTQPIPTASRLSSERFTPAGAKRRARRRGAYWNLMPAKSAIARFGSTARLRW